MKQSKRILLLLVATLVSFVRCDLPTNCSYPDTVGSWMLHLSDMNSTNQINCSKEFKETSSLQVELTFPNKIVDVYGHKGTWSMIYNQGFEIILNGRHYFAFQYYEKISDTETVSYCHETFNGWTHDVVKDDVFPPKNWGCYKAHKLLKKNIVYSEEKLKKNTEEYKPYSINLDYIAEINAMQSSWKAGVYEQYQNFTLNSMRKYAGGGRLLPHVKPRPMTQQMLEEAAALPESFDWRNVKGKNFVSPVRNQGSCGSCYAFGSMAMLEARVRIQTQNGWTPVFSTQNVVDCCQYSQGCDGGFPYLVAGMYAQDFGVVMDKGYPYIGNKSSCHSTQGQMRMFVSDYGYVGGFYGGCNEALMRVELVKNGPLAVSLEVYNDLLLYKGGIYHHTGLKDKFNPFEITNHIVLVVGYGVDHDSGEKYWIVKNSWGTSWGEGGFFRILRGADEVAIESIAVFAHPFVGQ